MHKKTKGATHGNLRTKSGIKSAKVGARTVISRHKMNHALNEERERTGRGKLII